MESEVYDRLAKAQSQMENPKMRGEGQIGSRRYSYASLSDVLAVVRKALNDNGLFLLQRTSTSEKGGLFYISTCVCLGDEVFELDREYYEYESDPQNFGKRETYARRYSLNKAFGLAGEPDTDGDTGPLKQPRPAAQKKQPKRQRMIVRISEMKARCIENGVSGAELDSYLKAHYQTDDVTQLTDDQLVEYGKQLSETVARFDKED